MIDEILPLLNGVKRNGDGKWIAKCPAHEDSRPSLSLRSVDGKVLVYCFAGCELSAISNAIGLRVQDWFDDAQKPPAARENAKLLSQSRANSRVVYRDELRRTGNELRRRDMEKIRISDAVNSGAMTEEAAWEKLDPLLTGYRELEIRFQELLPYA